MIITLLSAASSQDSKFCFNELHHFAKPIVTSMAFTKVIANAINATSASQNTEMIDLNLNENCNNKTRLDQNLKRFLYII